MVTQHLLSRTITVQLGDGRGHFVAAPASPIRLAYSPGGTKIGDVNGDRVPDLVVRRSERDVVDVYFGDAKGGFTLAAGSPFTAGPAVDSLTKPGLELLDLDQDGDLDIVLTNGRRNALPTLLGDGRGTFSRGPTTTLGPEPNLYSFAFGDVDGDGRIDAIVARSPQSSDPDRIVVRRGDGRGGFPDTLGTPMSVPPGSRLVNLADVDGDRRLDMVLSGEDGRLRFLLNAGSGAFTPASATYDVGAQAYAVVVADVNGDARSDLIAATVNSVTVLLGSAKGFAPATGSPYRAGPGAYNAVVADINGDRRPDIVASSFESDAVTVLLRR
jgi:hypothetical protein